MPKQENINTNMGCSEQKYTERGVRLVSSQAGNRYLGKLRCFQSRPQRRRVVATQSHPKRGDYR